MITWKDASQWMAIGGMASGVGGLLACLLYLVGGS